MVISNRVKATRDGQWRTIDGAPLHVWTVPASGLHEAPGRGRQDHRHARPPQGQDQAAWTRRRLGLAPSAAAAQVLADDLGIACENTAKWLYEHEVGGSRFQRSQLVIIDEATLAGTFSLDRITAHAAEAGAKVLLVGDWAQLQSVEAGGAFAMLADARGDAPELVDIHRFTHEWEKGASLDLRYGHP